MRFKDLYISCGVPSKRRPQPAPKSVSPQKSEGVNVTFNPVGLDLLKSSIGSLSYGGRSILMGEVSRPKEFFNTTDLIFKNANLIGSTGADKCHIKKAIEMVRRGLVTPVIG